MNKSLQQIQEENRRAIIMATNPEAKTYEEALKMELGFGCVVCIEGYPFKIIDSINQGLDCERYTAVDDWDRWHFDKNDDDIKIIGKPLTLDRVLLATKKINISVLIRVKILQMNL